MFFSLALTKDLSDKDWIELAENDTRPMFVMGYSQTCRHCQATMPSWVEFMNSMENETDVIIGRIDCTQHSDFCLEIGSTSYPSFLVHYQNTTSEVSFRRSVDGYKKVLNRIRKVVNKTMYKQIGEKAIKRYPAIIVRELNPISNAIAITSNYFRQPSFYINSSLTGELAVMIDPDLIIPFNTSNEYTLSEAIKFVKEHSVALLGEWSFQAVEDMKRLFAVAVSDNLSFFHDIAVKTYGLVAWGNAKALKGDKLQKLFQIGQNELPAVAILDYPNTRFAKIVNVSREDIEPFIIKAVNNQTEFISIVSDRKSGIKKSLNNAAIMIGIGIIVAVVLGVGSACCSSSEKPAPKVGQKEKTE